jgi:hypothetical protein
VPRPARSLADLQEHELRAIVADIQELLWLDVPAGGGEEFWNASKPPSLNTLGAIAGALEQFGLKPQEDRSC